MIDRLRGGKKEQRRRNFELKIKKPEINPTVAHLASGQFYWLIIPLIFTGRGVQNQRTSAIHILR